MNTWGISWGNPSAWGGSWGTDTVVVVTTDTHDGFDGRKHHDGRKRKERLHNQLEEAFLDAFGGRPVLPPVIARNDEPLMEFVFPAYREKVEVDPDEEAAEFLLLSN